MRYRVSTKGSIISPHGGEIMKPGMIVDDGYFTADQAREHVRSGFLVQLGTPQHEEKPLTGREDAPPLPNLDDEAKKRSDTDKAIVVGEGKSLETTKKPAAGPPIEHTSVWTMDPAQIRELSLDQLNALISERDKTIGRIESAAEAIQILSMDYKAG